MPSRARGTAAVLADISRQIGLAQSFVEGLSFEGFQADRRTVYAVIRCLEIISEASRRLPDDLKARHPEIPWAGMAGAGNVYRHDYEDVADDMVWRTVQNSLPPLLAVVDAELSLTRA
jgi:uncharacterized protein with HEPN domain